MVSGEAVGEVTKNVPVSTDALLAAKEYDQLMAVVVARQDPNLAIALGWKLKEANENAIAAEFFGKALELGAPPETNYAYALTLHLSGQNAKALEVAAAHEGDHPEMAGIKRSAALEVSATYGENQSEQIAEIVRKEFRKMAREIVEERDAALAESAGWIAYHDGQYGEAVSWFGKADEWRPSESTKYGLAIALFQGGSIQEAARLAKSELDSNPAMQQLYSSVLLHQANEVRSNPDSLFADILEQDLKEFEPHILKEKNAELALVLGWYYLNGGSAEQSGIWFDRVIEWGGRPEAYYGKALALEALGELDGALALATQYPQAHEGMRDMRERIALDKALSDATGGKIFDYLSVIEERKDAELANVVAWRYLEDDNYSDAKQWFRKALAWGGESDEAYGLALVALKEGKYGEVELLAQENLDTDPRMTSLSYMVEIEKLREGLETYDSTAFEPLNLDSFDLANKIMESRNGDAALEFAWLLLDREEFRAAGEWFDRAIEWGAPKEAWYGAVASRIQTGDLKNAYVMAIMHMDAHDDMPKLLVDLNVKATADMYERGSYEKVINKIETTDETRELTSGEMQILGWSYYETGRKDEAMAVFEHAYLKYRDVESADALAEMLASRWDWTKLEQMADDVGGPLRESYRNRLAQEHANRGNRRIAADIAPEIYEIEQFEVPTFEVGAQIVSQSSGEKIRNLQRTMEPQASIDIPFGRASNLGIKVGRQSFKQGRLSEDQLVGSPSFDTTDDIADMDIEELRDLALPFGQRPGETLDGAATVELSWQREGFISPFVNVGLVDRRAGGALATAKVGATIHGKGSALTVEGFREPVYQSVLSSVGLVDPYTGETWGGVSEAGIRGTYGATLNDNWTISSLFQYSYLGGEGVASNDHVKAAVGFSRNIDIGDNFSYFRVGPVFEAGSYDKNLSFYTLGHGGYFSPQQLFTTALAMEIMTAEERNWLVRARARLGYFSQDSDDTPLFPTMSLSQPFYEGSSDAGFILNTELDAAFALSERWILGLSAGFDQSADYNGWNAGIWMRYIPGLGHEDHLYEENLGD